MDQDLNQEIALCEAVVSRVKDLLTSGSNSWRSCLETVRTTITTLENSAFLSSPSLLDEQVKLVSTFQKLAYQEPDNGGEVDIASWCVRQWATMLQRHPNSLDSLKGLGHAWLLKSQACLARIDREERSSSSDTSSSSNVASRAQDLRQSRRDHDRIYTPDYIEARDLLRPALEYLARAVEVAEMQVSIDGHLLTLAAEAYMNFGNVSDPRTNEDYYRQALRYLQRTTQISGYSLEPHLQQYLEENLRLFD